MASGSIPAAPTNAKREVMPMGIAPYMTVTELADSWGTNPDKLHEYARRESDPLPIRYIKGKTRYGIVMVEEVNEWLLRNTVLANERKSA